MQPVLAAGNPWSGYGFWASSGVSHNVWEAIAYITVPTISNCLSGSKCQVAAWVGLTNDQSGANGIAQGGVAVYVDCSSSCGTTSYKAWWQFYPSGPTFCYNVNPGDVVYVDVVANTGNPSSYNVAVTDTTTGTACNQNGSINGGPYFANFMVEDPPGWTLAQFNTGSSPYIWFHRARMYYDGSWYSITTPFNAGTFNAYICAPPGCTGYTGDGVVQSDSGGYGQFFVQYGPNCSATASPTSGTQSVTVQFSVSCSGGLPPYSYYWQFNDGYGTTSKLQNPTNTYYCIGPGTSDFFPTLTVTDAQGVRTQPSVPDITVNAPHGCAQSPTP